MPLKKKDYGVFSCHSLKASTLIVEYPIFTKSQATLLGALLENILIVNRRCDAGADRPVTMRSPLTGAERLVAQQ